MIIIFSNNNEKNLFLRKTNFCLHLEKKNEFYFYNLLNVENMKIKGLLCIKTAKRSVSLWNRNN